MARRPARRNNRKRLGSIERDILEELTFGDFLYSFLLSARSTKLFYKLARERATSRYRRKLAMERLIDLEFIRRQGERLSITESGRSALGTAISTNLSLLQTKKWDGKWRVAAFDIPEKYSDLRDKMRSVLKRAGFVKLQHSVWVFPHECRELVELIKSESRLSPFILYGVLERIENEGNLRERFGL